MYEDELWDVVDFCWGVVVDAIKAGAVNSQLVHDGYE